MEKHKVPGWEAELWSSLENYAGVGCPIAVYCQGTIEPDWCPCVHRDYVKQFFDEKPFTSHKLEKVGSERGGWGGCKIFDMVETLAKKYLQVNGIHSPPVPAWLVSSIVEEHPVDIRELPLKSCHGALWYDAPGWVIHLNNSDSHPTKRFTLFHEAFHISVHHMTSTSFNRKGATRGPFIEMLADYFASCILMPRELIFESWAETKNPDEMAWLFDVPDSNMYVKLRQLDLV